MNKPNPPPGSQPTSSVRAQTMPLQRLVNRVIRGRPGRPPDTAVITVAAH